MNTQQDCCYCLVTKVCLTPCDHLDYSMPGSFFCGISQARTQVGCHSFTRDLPDPRLNMHLLHCRRILVTAIIELGFQRKQGQARRKKAIWQSLGESHHRFFMCSSKGRQGILLPPPVKHTLLHRKVCLRLRVQGFIRGWSRRYSAYPQLPKFKIPRRNAKYHKSHCLYTQFIQSSTEI